MINWIEKNNQLCKDFEFKDFKEALLFMLKCSYEMEAANHHPTWTNTYNKVSVLLSTHDAQNTVTIKDYELAAMMDKIFLLFNQK